MKNQDSNTLINNTVASEQISRSALERAPQRALTFLRAAGTNPQIFSMLAQGGYGKEEHMEGWKLLFDVSGMGGIDSQAISNPVADAIAELDAWVVPGFQRVRAVLHHKYREQEGFVFQNLQAQRGPEAVLCIHILLDRLTALESSADRKSSRKADHAALDALASRGITESSRKHLADLITIVQSETTAAVPTSQSERAKKLTALYDWVTDWSDTAHALIQNRGALIRLGVAKRRTKKDDAVTPVAPVVITPAPAPVATTPSLPPVAPIAQLPPATPAPVVATPVAPAADPATSGAAQTPAAPASDTNVVNGAAANSSNSAANPQRATIKAA